MPEAEFDERTTLPEILRAHPHLRAVLDRYGLEGCGGPEGPPETLAFFARAHGVEPERLLAELRAEARAAGRQPDASDRAGPRAGTESAYRPGRADTIYRRFFLAGIVATLTAGATWGALLLLRLGQARSFTAVGVHEVNAHGHAQIFGWVGLFVMGFAYQAFPRFRHTRLAWPALAAASFWIMMPGLVLRTASEALARPGRLPVWGAAGGGLELAAVALFVVVIGRTLASSPLRPGPYVSWIAASLFWFVVQAVYDLAYFSATMTAPTREALLALVADWQAPLRDIQIHGFALLMVLGVSQRFLPGMLGFREAPAPLSMALLLLMNLAVAGEAVSFVLFRKTGEFAWAAASWASILLLLGGAAAMTGALGIFRGRADRDRSVKFVRAAYVWLLVSLAMLALAPLWFRLLGTSFSHAYWGASRHAITVGFVSLMIVGVASKVVPTLAGVSPASLADLWAPFALVNAGCAMRVGFQTATDVWPAAFLPAGISGLLEVAGLALWAANLYPYLARGVLPAGIVHAGRRSGPVSPDETVASVLEGVPGAEEVLLRFGFREVTNPVLRRTVARTVSLRTACRMRAVDVDALVEALERARRSGSRELPILAGSRIG